MVPPLGELEAKAPIRGGGRVEALAGIDDQMIQCGQCHFRSPLATPERLRAPVRFVTMLSWRRMTVIEPVRVNTMRHENALRRSPRSNWNAS